MKVYKATVYLAAPIDMPFETAIDNASLPTVQLVGYADEIRFWSPEDDHLEENSTREEAQQWYEQLEQGELPFDG